MNCWWDCNLLWKTVWWFFIKIRNIISKWFSYSGNVHSLPNERSKALRDICTPMFIAGLLTFAKMWKQSKCPLICMANRYMNNVIPNHNDILSLLSIRITAIQTTKISVDKYVKKLEPLYNVSENIKWCSYYGKQYALVIENLKIEFTWPSNFILCYISKRIEIRI